MIMHDPTHAEIDALRRENAELRAQLAEIDAEIGATQPEHRIPLIRTLRVTADAARGFLQNVVLR